MRLTNNEESAVDTRFVPDVWEEDREEESEEEPSTPQKKEEPAVTVGDTGKRIVLVNLDWESIDSKDVYRIVSGFAEKEEIVGARIYKTKYGRAMLEKEEKEGPPIAFSRRNQEREVREYIKNKMRYFYAVIEFTSAEVAKSVYEIIDGMEIDDTKHIIDARFIPDSKVIEDELVEEASQVSKLNKKLSKNPLFHTKVHLAWEEDTERERTFRDLFVKGDIDMDLAEELIDASDNEDKQEMYKQQIEAHIQALYQEEPESSVEENVFSGDVPEKEHRSHGCPEEEEIVKEESSESSEEEVELPEDSRFSKENTNPDFSVDPTHPQFIAKKRKTKNK